MKEVNNTGLFDEDPILATELPKKKSDNKKVEYPVLRYEDETERVVQISAGNMILEMKCKDAMGKDMWMKNTEFHRSDNDVACLFFKILNDGKLR